MSLYDYATSVANELVHRTDEDLWQSCSELVRHVFGFDMALTHSTLCFDVYKYLVNNVSE